jgi:tetratricopeptide (TPR) repeat protein
MSGTQRRGTALLLGFTVLGASLVLSGCASAGRTALKQATAASAGAIAAGDYGQALELYQKLYEKDRANGKVVSKYAALIEDVKAFGDEAENKGSYAAAQGIYRLLSDRWDGFSALASRLSFQKADLDAQWKDCRLALCERQFRQDMESGSYAKALGAYQGALKDYPGDKTVQARFAKGLAEIAKAGDRAREAKDYATAGRIYGLVLRNAQAPATVAPTEGGPDLNALLDAIKACSMELVNSGLAEYRKGNIEGAIGIWDELLSFDPANAEIKKAVETARTQLGKLKGSGKGGSRASRGGRAARGAH